MPYIKRNDNMKNLKIQPVKMRNNFNFADVFFTALIVLFAVLCLIPFLIIVSASLSDEMALTTHGYGFIPIGFTTYAYSLIFGGAMQVAKSYMVTIIVTVVGTIVSTFLSLLFAYPLSRKNFKYRNILSFFVFFTLLFNGGYVAWYIVCANYLHLRDSYFALIIPYLFNAWYLIILKNFLATIPESIEEAARIDGAGDFRILFTIIVPLAKPGIATVALFTSLGYWNDWWLGFMLTSGRGLIPLQLYLINMLQAAEFIKNSINLNQMKSQNIPAETLRMAVAVIATGPIVLAYPFFQRYIVKGITIGSVKG